MNMQTIDQELEKRIKIFADSFLEKNSYYAKIDGQLFISRTSKSSYQRSGDLINAIVEKLTNYTWDYFDKYNPHLLGSNQYYNRRKEIRDFNRKLVDKLIEDGRIVIAKN